MSLIPCPECQKPVSEAASACPACGFTLSPDVIATQKERKRKSDRDGTAFGMIFIGLFVLLFLICSGVFSPKSSSSDSSSSATSTSSPAFASDKERLEWRSQNHVPMNAEDVRYEQDKLMEAAKKIKASEYSVGR